MKDYVEEWARQGLIEKLLEGILKGSKNPVYKDLCQDLYLDLLQKPKDRIQTLVIRQEHIKYIVGMIKKNIHSNTSPFYRTYRDFSRRSRPVLESDEEAYYLRASQGITESGI